MAELKAPYAADQSTTQRENPEPSPAPKRPEIVVVPISPARKLSRISGIEKIIAAVLVVSIVALSIAMINLRTTINRVEHDISVLQEKVTENEAATLQLEQERNELSKSERIQKIAEEEGLSIDSDNLRKVKK